MASHTGRNTSSAAATSCVVAANTASSAVAPDAASSATCASYDVSSGFVMAFAKIVGLVVTPVTLREAISSARLPEEMRVRDRSSSQMLTPAAARSEVGVLMRSP